MERTGFRHHPPCEAQLSLALADWPAAFPFSLLRLRGAQRKAQRRRKELVRPPKVPGIFLGADSSGRLSNTAAYKSSPPPPPRIEVGRFGPGLTGSPLEDLPTCDRRVKAVMTGKVKHARFGWQQQTDLFVPIGLDEVGTPKTHASQMTIPYPVPLTKVNREVSFELMLHLFLSTHATSSIWDKAQRQGTLMLQRFYQLIQHLFLVRNHYLTGQQNHLAESSLSGGSKPMRRYAGGPPMERQPPTLGGMEAGCAGGRPRRIGRVGRVGRVGGIGGLGNGFCPWVVCFCCGSALFFCGGGGLVGNRLLDFTGFSRVLVIGECH